MFGGIGNEVMAARSSFWPYAAAWSRPKVGEGSRRLEVVVPGGEQK